ncbi:ATP-binding protein [Azospirillum sp. TSO22-1]|uniref:hybrid sensor histidine kinase/response regulator n=1 Tax=Azospirillum sp. TSO22-1 TaxID=716789 RepID=UPI000D650E3F|nr:ATP-binding protein [Azospirillum sp. TSO22-1]
MGGDDGHLPLPEPGAGEERERAIRKAIFDGASHLIIATDATGTIIDVNPAAERALGYRRDELVGLCTPIRLHDMSEIAAEAERLSAELGERIPPGFEVFVARPRRGHPTEREWTYLRKDGSRFPVLLGVSPLYGKGDELLGFVGVSTDLTERKAHERAVIAAEAEALARKEAERANDAKTRFLAAASHDLRQPLQSALLFAAALAPHVAGPRGREVLGSLDRSLESLRTLLDRLLDISKLDAGVVKPVVAAFPIGRLLDELDVAYAPRAAFKGLAWRVTPAATTVRSDPDLLGRILRNLIENALRYTAQGVVEVNARTEGGALLIEVRDTGAGIAEDSQEAIFQEFHRIGTADTVPGGDKGLGLGLAIVRRLSHLLDHPVTVRSTPGAGSVFAVRVPLGDASAAHQAPQPVPAAPGEAPAASGKRVLVVDDDPLLCTALSSMIRHWGYEVVDAGSRAEAEAKLDAVPPPELVVTDYRLGDGTTGIDLLAALARRGVTPMRGILLTGETGSALLDEARSLGCAVLHKPVAPPALRQALAGN